MIKDTIFNTAEVWKNVNCKILSLSWRKILSEECETGAESNENDKLVRDMLEMYTEVQVSSNVSDIDKQLTTKKFLFKTTHCIARMLKIC